MHTRIPTRTMGAIFFDQFGTFAEPPVILGVVAARLGDIVVEVEEHLVAHDLFIVNLWVFGHRLANKGVRILAMPLKLEIPGHVIDASTSIRDLVHGSADPAGQHGRCALNAVTQAGEADAGLPLRARQSMAIGLV